MLLGMAITEISRHSQQLGDMKAELFNDAVHVMTSNYATHSGGSGYFGRGDCLVPLLTTDLFLSKSLLVDTRLQYFISGLFFCICVPYFSFLSFLIFTVVTFSTIFQNETPANHNMTHVLNSWLFWPSQACHVI